MEAGAETNVREAFCPSRRRESDASRVSKWSRRSLPRACDREHDSVLDDHLAAILADDKREEVLAKRLRADELPDNRVPHCVKSPAQGDLDGCNVVDLHHDGVGLE